MDILQAAAALNPGTAWNMTKDANGNRTLVQAVDGTARVSVPSLTTLDAYVAAHPDPDAKALTTALGAAISVDPKLSALITLLQAKGVI